MRAVGCLFVLAIALTPSCSADVTFTPPDAGPDGATPSCTSDASCDDHVYCNGVEHCTPSAAGADAHGCVHGAPACATGTCSETTHVCDTSCTMPDADHDGVRSMTCGGNDCDDADPHRFPGNAEVCDPSHDEDCDATTVGARDMDADGFVDAHCCNGALCSDDCDDMRASTHPGAAETCNTIDDDCDGSTDESLATATYARDCDGDGFGEIAGVAVTACAAPPAMPGCMAWSTMATDCDDADATDNPGNPETCDGHDNDCDLIVDEGLGGTSLQLPCYPDADADGRAPLGSTAMGVCVAACPAFTTAVVPVDPAHADCNDADAAVADLVSGLVDGDGDHVGAASALGCPTGQANFLPGVSGPIDCDDGNPDIFPGQTRFFPTPTGRGCLDATYHLVCGNGTCGRLVMMVAPPITLPTCGTMDVRPDQALWNYDCDPHPTGPPLGDACTGCGPCSGGYIYSSTSQCGGPVTQNACNNACSISGPHFCNLASSAMATLPCR